MKRVGALVFAGGLAVVLAGCGAGKNNAGTIRAIPSGSTTRPVATKSGQTAAPVRTTSNAKHVPETASLRYERQMQVLGSELAGFFQKVGQEDASASAHEAIANMRKVQSHLRSAAVALTAMSAPARIRRDQQLLIVAVREYATELNGVIAQLKAGNLSELSFIPELKGIQDMSKATKLILAAGYDITGGSPAASGGPLSNVNG